MNSTIQASLYTKILNLAEASNSDLPSFTQRQISDLFNLMSSEFALELSMNPQQIYDSLPPRLANIFKIEMTKADPIEGEIEIGNLHYHLAQILRAKGIGDERENNDSPILNYYLKHEEATTPLYQIDMIRYGVASEFYSKIFKEKETEMLVARDTIISWERTLEEKTQAVVEIESRLTTAKNTQNFLGLSRAFAKLLSRKRVEYYFYVAMLSLLGCAALAIPTANLGEPTQSIVNELLQKQFSDIIIAKAFLVAIVEILILYYFKIMLQSWNQVKAQILQLELRESLCAFAENYAEFAKKNVTGETLGKFESLIFSEITNEATPNINLFDATDALSKIASSFKKT